METTEELQQLEITALKSIYEQEFFEPPPPKVWKGAARLPEFIIKVAHPDPLYAHKVYFHLHTKFPRTYPTLATPIFTIQKPIRGLSHDVEVALSKAINAEAQKLRGSEMVFQIVTTAQEWIAERVQPPSEASGSLATEMTKRATQEERERREREEAEAQRQSELAARIAEQLQEQLQVDAQKHLIAKELQYKAARRRAQSDATEVPSVGDTLTESFPTEIEFRGIRFNAVKMFHPRKECLGVTYLADPLCDDVHATLPLEVHTIEFDTEYYVQFPGRKKLEQLEAEIQRLMEVQHPNLLSVLAVKLSFPHLGPPRLAILSEQRPALTLQDVLEDCDSLREDRASDYLAQILSALNAVHSSDLVHRSLDTTCVYLATRENKSHSKLVKVGKTAYHARVKDLHRSDPFSSELPLIYDEFVPDSWLSKDSLDSVLSYSKDRDIHSVGVVFLQMLHGQGVMQKFSTPREALQAAPISPTLQVTGLNMLSSSKKSQMSCLSLLADLASMSLTSTRVNTPAIPVPVPRTPIPHGSNYGTSPEKDYHLVTPRARQASRWKEDWEELELLGKGAFGSVVKARNKIDSRIYAVKKIRLRTNQRDTRIFREVNALSRLSHRYIVRYYTTWVEMAETIALGPSSDSETASDSGTEGNLTSVPHSFREKSDPFTIDLSELDDYGGSGSKSSFPSIHFTRSDVKDEKDEDEDDSDDGLENLFTSDYPEEADTKPPPVPPRTLYIQMEFVERQTLRERVAEGLSEEEAWRLFDQILEALVHMGSMGILHRDIKLANIFIDKKGDCKVGDFGLATSSLAAVDPSDLSPKMIQSEDYTLEVGTTLYIAPEVSSRKKGPSDHNKADMYSLGIVFFEMNYPFSTGAERIAVIEDLRKPEVYFPRDWEAHRTRQKEIISWLLRHDPARRPSALDLSQSMLLPPRVEDEYFKEALRMISAPDSTHYQTLLSVLFKRPASQTRQSRNFLYDLEADIPEHANLNTIVEDRMKAIFRLHGAVDIEPPLLVPSTSPEENESRATFIDGHGDVVFLPNLALIPFARLAARNSVKRIKRFHIMNTYRPNAVPGHPKMVKAAVLDIITADMKSGMIAAGAELILLLSDCLRSFPNLAQVYEMHISHSRIVELALSRVPDDLRPSVMDIMNQSKSTPSQKRASLLKKGLLRSTADELEVFAEIDEDIDGFLTKLEKISPSLITVMKEAVDEIKQSIHLAASAGFNGLIYLQPLMWAAHHAHFQNGVRLEVVRRARRQDVLAAAGRYDNLIAQYSAGKAKNDPICAFAVQIALDKITMNLASFQSTSVKALVKEQRSFGFWSPRRCDVYIMSYQPGYLQDRLEVAALLWQNNISADIMYEATLGEAENESHLECSREGILFVLYPRPRALRREQAAFKIKSILRGNEYEISRQDLVGWLQQQIAEQKRIDASTSGTVGYPAVVPASFGGKDTSSSGDVQLLLPADTKKHRKQVKQILLDRAYERGAQFKAAATNGVPMLAMDVPSAVFDALVRSPAWIHDEDVWKTIVALMPTLQTAYAAQLREAVAKKKAEGHPFMLLYAIREERTQILNLSQGVP